MEAATEDTPLVTPRTVLLTATAKLMQGNKSRRYAILNRISKRMKKTGANESIEDVLRDIESSERVSSRMFIGSMLAILLHMAFGITVLSWLEEWSLYNAAYFCVVTTTTVGYGDITPTRSASKAFVIYYVIVSIAIISTLLAFVVGTLIDRQEELLLQAIGEGEGECSDEEGQEAHTSTDSAVDKADVQELLVSVFWLLVILSLGVVVFWRIEKLSLLNAMYVTVISASTVGFGDLQPTHESSKLIMTVWLSFSTIVVAKVVGEVAGLFAKMKQKAATRRVLCARMDVKTLMCMDQDNDQRVSKAEFLAQMLIRTGKVADDDVRPVLRRFCELDSDNNGFITLDEAGAAMRGGAS